MAAHVVTGLGGASDPGWQAAAELTRRLAAGRGLPGHRGCDGFGIGEVVHARARTRADRFCAAEAAYEEEHFVAFGGAGLLALTAAASLAANARRRSEAAAAAAPQWRWMGPGDVIATDRRLVVGDPLTGTSVWYSTIRQVAPDLPAPALGVQADGHDPLRFTGPWVPYLAVTVTWLVHGTALHIPSRPARTGPPPPPPPARRRRRFGWLVG